MNNVNMLNDDELNNVSGGIQREKIENELIRIIATQKGLELLNINGRSRLGADLGADSLDVVDIIGNIENHFNIAIKESEFGGIGTIRDFTNLIEQKINAKA